MVDDVELKACPHCGTTMHQHEYCFSHPKPATGDCILRHYSFDNSKREAWNTRTPSPVSVEEAKDAKLIKRFTGWLNYVTSNSNRRVNEPSTEEYRRLIELASAALSARP
jgi:rRNA maturation endonuclease Nob1